MGYTHYWRQKRAFTDTEWAAICVEAERIIRAATAAGIKLAGPCGELGTPPEVNSLDTSGLPTRVIALNGLGPDEDHEPLALSKEQRPLREWEKHDAEEMEDIRVQGVLSFCKTARKPYDRVVTNILAAARGLASDAITLSSDGGDEAFEIDKL